MARFLTRFGVLLTALLWASSGGPVGAAPTVRDVTIPQRGGGQLEARVYVPDAGSKSPPYPLIGLLPGGGAGISSVEWAATDLAKNGYLVITAKPARGGSAQSYATALMSALDFVLSGEGPYAALVSPRAVGAAGWSLGARALTLAQEQDPRIKAIVAWDNLAATEAGDQGSPSGAFNPSPSTFRQPRVPALGLASDRTTSGTGVEEKKTAFDWWRGKAVPVMQVVFAGSNHFWWSARATQAQHDLTLYYTRAWFDRWVRGDRSATKRLLSPHLPGGETPSRVLSTRFRSAVFLDGRDFSDLRDHFGR